jgi:hypothetical protein
MPIRLCQKCGLKVLIDESQAGTNPFYCQRCTTAMKGQESGAPAPGPITPVKNPTPSPVMGSRSEPAAPSVNAAKPATVRVLCPYCKASFNGRVPQKPARGSCPVCQKELILLPNGDIKPASGFDLNTWQADQAAGTAPAGEAVAEAPPEPAIKESNTRMLVKKYAAAPPAAKLDPSRAAPKGADETEINEEPSALPGWLDDGGGRSAPVKAPPETDTGLDAVAKNDSAEITEDLKEPPPPPPPPPRARSPIAAKMASVSPGRPPASVAPPPPPEPEVDLLPEPPPPPPPPPGPRLARGPSGERRAPAPPPSEPVGAGSETGSGKVFFALILALLPVAACAGLLHSPELQKNDLIKKFAPRFSKGLEVLHSKMFPPPPPPPPPPKIEMTPEPPKEEPPKADPQQQKKDGDKISNLFAEIKRGERDLKQSKVAASPEQLRELEKVQAALDEKKARYAQWRETYHKMYGVDYDPEKQ